MIERPNRIHLPFLLKYYRNSDISFQMKARFVYYIYVLGITLLAVAATRNVIAEYLQFGLYGINYMVLIFCIVGLFIYIFSFIQLLLGRFRFASHFVLISSIALVWAVIFVDVENIYGRFNPVLIVVGLLSLLSFIVQKKKIVIFLYVFFNILALLIVVYLLRDSLSLGITGISFLLGDSIIAMLIVGLTVYNNFIINKVSYDSIKSEMQIRKESEDVLRKSEKMFRHYFINAPIPLASMNRETEEIRFNLKLTKLFGALEEGSSDMQSLLLRILPDSDYRKSILEDIHKLIGFLDSSDRDNLSLEGSFMCQDGVSREMIVNIDKIDQDLLFSLIDMSELRDSEKDREQLQNQLLHSQKMESIGRLAGGVAHDFNNMLGAIIGYAEMGQEYTEGNELLNEAFDGIIKAADSSAQLTKQLLAFARKQTVDLRLLDLNETIEGMVRMLKRLIGESIDLIWLAGAKLPPVLLDSVQLNQILVNLSINARDAMSGFGKITIETGFIHIDQHYCDYNVGFTPGDFVAITFSDDGCGISNDVIDKIFDPFYTTKSSGKGTGLGLSTIYGIVQQNGGFIKVYSEIDVGTSFKIYFPSQSGDILPIEALSSIDYSYLEGKKIFLIEDEEILNRQIVLMLTQLGFEVTSAGGPNEALELLSSFDGGLDLFLSDLIMPNMNGRELISKLLEIRPNVEVLYMSGYSSNVVSNKNILDDSINFIQKPFNKSDLLRKISDIIG